MSKKDNTQKQSPAPASEPKAGETVDSAVKTAIGKDADITIDVDGKAQNVPVTAVLQRRILSIWHEAAAVEPEIRKHREALKKIKESPRSVAALLLTLGRDLLKSCDRNTYKAAALFAATCKYAEETAVSDYANKHGGEKVSFRDLLSSWQPAKTNVTRALRGNKEKGYAPIDLLATTRKSAKGPNGEELAPVEELTYKTPTQLRAALDGQRAVKTPVATAGEMTYAKFGPRLGPVVNDMIALVSSLPPSMFDGAAEIINKAANDVRAASHAQRVAQGVEIAGSPAPARTADELSTETAADEKETARQAAMRSGTR